MRRLVVLLTVVFGARSALGHSLYLASDNHVDYGWNDSVANVESAMIADVDYYRSRIDATSGNPPEEQAHFNFDSWYWLWLYQHGNPASGISAKSPAEFADVMAKMLSGHFAAPLNPLVTLYGALSTEAAIRAGYWPGRLQRQWGVEFLVGEEIETGAIPWGVSSIWYGSGTRYGWKGVCHCTMPLLGAHPHELFRWQGPDAHEILMKWYNLGATGVDDYKDWGGYEETRKMFDAAVNLASPCTGNDACTQKVQQSFDHLNPPTSTVAPGTPTPTAHPPISALFGQGGDNVHWGGAAAPIAPASGTSCGTFSLPDSVGDCTKFPQLIHNWNQTHVDKLSWSNQVDFFQALEAYRGQLRSDRGGWGNEWDLCPELMPERIAMMKRATEQLHVVEAMAAVVHRFDQASWAPRQDALETGIVDLFKFFEHTWGALSQPLIAALIANKKQWAVNWSATVSTVDAATANAFAALFSTPADEHRFVVFNPLVFDRSDYADLPAPGPGPFVVTDVTTLAEVPNQIVTIGASKYLRILASNVPSLGYRMYRYASGVPSPQPSPTVDRTNGVIENSAYRVVMGARGGLAHVIEKASGKDLVGAATLMNDFGIYDPGYWSPLGPPDCTYSAMNVGMVSATLACTIGAPGPTRQVRVTLTSGVARVEIEDEITQSVVVPRGSAGLYRFNVNLATPQIKMEEVGAIARPGYAPQGDFLTGGRFDYLTLNHFVNFEQASPAYNITLSNWDAQFVKIGNPVDFKTFDLATPEANVVALGDPGACTGETSDQFGDTDLLERFAVAGGATAYSGAAALRFALAHQNPLRAIALPPHQTGELAETAKSFLSVDRPNIVVTACKPAEEGERGWVVRLWELNGSATSFTINASAFAPIAAFEVSLIETDMTPVPLEAGGQIDAGVAANQLKAYRFVAALGAATVTASPTATRTASTRATATATATAVPSNTATAPSSATATSAATPTQTETATAPLATPPPTPPSPSGDVNGDGVVDQNDVAAVITALFTSQPLMAADVNRDARITSADVSAVGSLLR